MSLHPGGLARNRVALVGAVLAITVAGDGRLTPARAVPTSDSVGHTIVFARGPAGGSRSDLFSMNADGSGVVRLTSTGHAAHPAWSPDGRQIAFDSEGPQALDAERSVIYVMNVDGSGIHRLLPGARPAWSPDGRRLLFETRAGALAVVNTDGTGRRVLAGPGGGDESGGAWSPDGRRIAFGQQHYGGWGITVMNADGSGQRFLTNRTPMGGHFYETDPAWSPDGRQIAFSEEYDCACDLVGPPNGSYTAVGVVNADGSELRKDGFGFRLLTRDGVSSSPSWSPDGKRITYDGGVPHQAIHVMDADGKHKLRLTVTHASSFEPDWSPVR